MTVFVVLSGYDESYDVYKQQYMDIYEGVVTSAEAAYDKALSLALERKVQWEECYGDVKIYIQNDDTIKNAIPKGAIVVDADCRTEAMWFYYKREELV